MTNPNYFDRLIDEPALQRYLETTTPGSADEFDIDYHREGKSNETLFLDWGDYNLVLRRPPAGATAESAHTCTGNTESWTHFRRPTFRSLKQWRVVTITPLSARTST